MVLFEDVLGDVRLALTWASPAEIRALLEGLVEEEIISEAYSKSLSLHHLIEGFAPKCIHIEPPCNSQSLRKFGSSESGESDISDHSQTNLESVLLLDEHNSKESWTNMHPLYECQVIDGYNQKFDQELRVGPAMDEHYLNHRISSTRIMCDIECSLDDDEEIAELLRSAESMQKPVSDSERTCEGNSEDEREWLDQVEEAARRIAVPLWQHWDRGQKMLLPLVPSTTTSCLTSENIVTVGGAQCPILKMEEETELAIACRTLGLYIDNFREGNVTDTSFTLDTEEATDTPEDLCFSTNGSVVMPGLNVDHFSISGAVGNASPVEACTATDTNNNLTDRLEDHIRTTEDLLCLTTDVRYGTDAGFIGVADLLSPSTPTDTFTIAQDNSFFAITHHSMTLGITDNLENVSESVSSTTPSTTDVITDFLDNKEDEERVDLHWGKFALKHPQIMLPILISAVV